MARPWRSDSELFDFVRNELFSAVVGDVMDQLGLLRQFLPARIGPLDPGMRVVGRAMPVLMADRPEDGSDRAPPFGLMFEALDDLKRDEVYVCGGGSPRYALWGELMSVRARMLGAAGAVVDGCYRDSDGIVALRFPTFGHGAYAQDQGPRGKVVDYRSPIRVGGVSVRAGDVVVGDRDGVCIVPRLREEEVFALALEKVRDENLVRKAIEAGMTSREAFDKYGVM